MWNHKGMGSTRMAVALLTLALSASAASAQEATLFGVGAVDGDGTNIQLVGASVRPLGEGLKPVVGIQAYRLQYDNGGTGGDATVFAVTPSVGLQYRMTGGAVEGRVGYTFQDKDVEAPFIEGEGGSSGVVTTFSANSWATRPELQGIVSYNWESDFVWTQGQAVLPVMDLSPGNLGVGAEVTYMANNDDYHAMQIGPVVRFNNGRNLIVALGAGYKDNHLVDDTWYARLTLVNYGIRF